MAVAHGTKKPLLLEHKAAIDRHLAEVGMPVTYTECFLGRPERDQTIRDLAPDLSRVVGMSK